MRGACGFLISLALAVATLPACGAGAGTDATDSQTSKSDLTDSQIRKILIEESIKAYKGQCACPYSLDGTGHKCKDQSAYRQRGGDRPMCFQSDVSKTKVKEYRDTHRQ